MNIQPHFKENLLVNANTVSNKPINCLKLKMQKLDDMQGQGEQLLWNQRNDFAGASSSFSILETVDLLALSHPTVFGV